MIVITGPGRTGTSALALLYRELGFDPGGSWIPEYRAGLEHGDFWRLNNKLGTQLGMSMFRPPVKLRDDPTHGAKSRVRLARWDRFDDVVAEHRDQMVELAATTPVVKDPRFLFTLPLWIAAGADISHVTVTMRKMTDIVASRTAAGQSEFNVNELRNSLTYGVGVLSATLFESGVSHATVPFPAFLTDLDLLYAALRFPAPVEIDRFRAVAATVFDRSQVHDWSATSPSG